MKKTIYIFAAAILLFTSCASSCATSTKKEGPKVDSLAYYREEVKLLHAEIKDLEDQVDILQEAIQFREGEISYWGHKYDSCMTILNNKKK